jgi:hypothetical protein
MKHTFYSDEVEFNLECFSSKEGERLELDFLLDCHYAFNNYDIEDHHIYLPVEISFEYDIEGYFSKATETEPADFPEIYNEEIIEAVFTDKRKSFKLDIKKCPNIMKVLKGEIGVYEYGNYDLLLKQEDY